MKALQGERRRRRCSAPACRTWSSSATGATRPTRSPARCRRSSPPIRRGCCLLVGEAEDADLRLDGRVSGRVASVLVRRLQPGRNHRSFSEQVTLHAAGGAVGKLPFAVRAPAHRRSADQPVVAVAAAAAAGRAAAVRPGGERPADHLRQPRLARAGAGVAATSSWLEQFEQDARRSLAGRLGPELAAPEVLAAAAHAGAR